MFLQKHSRLGKKYPYNFEINRVLVDNYNDWSEGFEKIEFLEKKSSVSEMHPKS